MVLLAAVGLAAGCSGLENDPEELSLAVARATYERDTDLLHEYASPALVASYRSADDRGEDRFAEGVEYVLRLGEVPEGELRDGGDGAQRAPVLFAAEGLSFYDVPATDPDGREVMVDVALLGDERDGYSFCAVSVRDQGDNIYYSDSFQYLLGGEETCGA